LHPEICLPVQFTSRFTRVQQEAMLLHELAHIAAHDTAWYFLADLAAAFWWWHPLLWWARRNLQAATEQAADEASLLAEDGPNALAECLVQIGQRLQKVSSYNLLGVEGNGLRSSLGRRVWRLLNMRGPGQVNFRARWQTSFAYAGGVLIFAIIMFTGSTWHSGETSLLAALNAALLKPARPEESVSANSRSDVSSGQITLGINSALPEPEQSSSTNEIIGVPAGIEEPATFRNLHTRWFKVDQNTMLKELRGSVNIIPADEHRNLLLRGMATSQLMSMLFPLLNNFGASSRRLELI
jgi:hypothetical protein